MSEITYTTDTITITVSGRSWTAPKALWARAGALNEDGTLHGYQARLSLGFAAGVGACAEPPSGDVSDRLLSFIAWRDHPRMA